MSYEDLENLLPGETENAAFIWETSKNVREYYRLKSVIDLGLNVDFREIPFEKLIVFSWIREAKSGRKN